MLIVHFICIYDDIYNNIFKYFYKFYLNKVQSLFRLRTSFAMVIINKLIS